MVEPPGDLGRTGVLEIDDGVFIAVKMGFVKEGACAGHESGEYKVGIFANPFAIETGEECGGGSPVETLAVIEDSDFQIHTPVVHESPPPNSPVQPLPPTGTTQ